MMPSKKFSSLLFLVIFCLNFSLSAHQEPTSNTYDQDFSINPIVSLKKIYVQPSELHITSEGIFFLDQEGCLERACGVFRDSGGLYVMAAFYQCPACGRMNRNNVCEKPTCPLYGK